MTRDYWNLYTDRKVSQRLETIGPPLQTVCLCYRTSYYYRPICKDSIVSDGSSELITKEILTETNYHGRGAEV